MRKVPHNTVVALQAVRKAIGLQLRGAYEETVQESIPGRHGDLLQQLERTETVQKELTQDTNRPAKEQNTMP
jgi:membrane-bound ClpP family serine protease